MSHRDLQAALVRAMYDDGFAARLRADPEGVLAPLGLDTRERAQLAAVDPRAFRTDPLRKRRTMRTLAEEYKGATTILLAETRSLAAAEAFFGSERFAASVRESDRPMALELGEWLREQRLTAPLYGEIARLELTMARCRRGRELPPRMGVALAPGVAVGKFDGATLDAIQRIEQYLFELGLMPQVALCDDAPRLPVLPVPRPGDSLHLLFTPSETGVSLAQIDPELHDVLAVFAGAEGIARGEVAKALARVGVSASQVDALVESLLAERLLARA
jgi:hypothetical protein